jgi:subtilisin-like proprotein convertase family protein
LEDTVCLGQNTILIGGVTANDTVGVQVPGGDFLIGGIFAGLTFLPDGAGQSYQSSVGISGFDTSATISSAADINELCLDIEHSYIGDIEITLTCPNGTTVSILNAYNGNPSWPPLVPGGCGSGISTSLGNDTNVDGGPPGSPVWTYCFSPTNATLGTICDEQASGNTIPNDYNSSGQFLPNGTTGNNTAMDTNGVYLPDGNFSDFVGCPVNGQWTITVQDNQGIDDGYIFQWGIYFNSSLYPESEGYQNTIEDDYWSNDPSIISGMSDTLIVIQPNVTGNTYYTYNVVDNFGCEYDTTVKLNVVPTPTMNLDSLACFFQSQIQGTTAFDGGTWFAQDTCIHFSNPNLNNPNVTSSVAGIYQLNFVDNFCQDTITESIEFQPFIYTELIDTTLCQGAGVLLKPLIVNSEPLQSGYNPNISTLWNDGTVTPTLVVNETGNYILYISNECYTNSDTATIGVKPCDLEVPNILVLSSAVGNNAFFVNYSGITKFNCIILNRWGNLIFEYDEPAGSWNGKTLDGKLVEEGTYFYKINATFEGGKEVEKHGFVVLKY